MSNLRRIVELWRRLAPWPYECFGALLQRWSFNGLRPRPHRTPVSRDERIGYVLWRYPLFSETFIRREVLALARAGASIEVFALEPDDPPMPEDPSSPSGAVTYYGPSSTAAGRRFILRCLSRRPLTVLSLWLFIVRHRYRSPTRWWQDRDVLYEAGQLASALAKRGITHVHSPWANQYALLSFVAARLLGITFTAQARASEIRRFAQAPHVADRLRFAEFVITNSWYNERYLRALLGPMSTLPIHVVYNGVELRRFVPIERSQRETRPLRLLSVGRLVEPKGFRYLLLACRLLRDRGVEFCCEIIGGPAEPADTVTWLELRMLLNEHHLESAVHFRGAQSFSLVMAAYQHADVFVLPCVHARDGSQDITPNSLLEAMAMALPVVSTTSGAIPEIVDDGENGQLVPPNDERLLADVLARLAADAPLRSTLGAAARRKIEERFDVDRNVTKRVALFQSLRAK